VQDGAQQGFAISLRGKRNGNPCKAQKKPGGAKGRKFVRERLGFGQLREGPKGAKASLEGKRKKEETTVSDKRKAHKKEDGGCLTAPEDSKRAEKPRKERKPFKSKKGAEVGLTLTTPCGAAEYREKKGVFAKADAKTAEKQKH